MHTARMWMASATPGGAPGYDDDKQFGNFITHMAARTSQRLRGTYLPAPRSQGKARNSAIRAVYRGFLPRARAKKLLAAMQSSPASTSYFLDAAKTWMAGTSGAK